jgi:hypothetical protein
LLIVFTILDPEPGPYDLGTLRKINRNIHNSEAVEEPSALDDEPISLTEGENAT